MRLDHLLSKEKEVGIVLLLSVQSRRKRTSETEFPQSRLRRLYDLPSAVEKASFLNTSRTDRALTYVTRILLVAMRLRATPVPIPNTTVKTQAADGTALETVWESRWMPDQMGM